jgi:hypothetical protein
MPASERCCGYKTEMSKKQSRRDGRRAGQVIWAQVPNEATKRDSERARSRREGSATDQRTTQHGQTTRGDSTPANRNYVSTVKTALAGAHLV